MTRVPVGGESQQGSSSVRKDSITLPSALLSLLDSIPGCVAAVVSSDTLQVVARNRHARNEAGGVGLACFEAIAGQTEPCAFCHVAELLASGSPQHLEVEHQGRWYQWTWAPLSEGLFVEYLFDFSDRKKAELAFRESKRSESALAESERRLATLMANLPGMAYRCENDPDWTMRFVSEGCEELTGYAASRLLGNAEVSYADLIVEEDRDETWQRVQAALEVRGPFHLAYRIITADQTVKWVWERGRGIFTDSGDLLFLEGFITDVSERVQTEAALRERDDQLRQSQKMEAIGQLAGGIAHDFNNLLAIILGYSEFLIADGSLGQAAHNKAEEIRRAAERAASLTGQILAFSRRQPLRPKVVSLNDVVAGMEPLLRRTLGEDLEFVARLAPHLGWVEADANQFEQVLMNLAVNARDAMRPGGTLTVQTANVRIDEDGRYAQTGAAYGSHVMLAVTDTGTGMTPEIREKVFEPFFTTKPPGSGTGLGLSMVYGIVKQSLGSIEVESAPGHGSTFRIFLPWVAHDGACETALTAPAPPPAGRETVLIVEDEESLRRLMADILRGYGFEVAAGGTAGEALHMVETEGQRPDIVVTDVVLPGGMQGDQLAQRLGTLIPGLPVLFVSGYSRDTIVHEGRLDPSVTLLEKPFTPKQLAQTVRELLNQRRPAR